ncbi:dimethyl sulfoxide reductase subunit H [Salmonella sp. NCTC 11881]|nr:dimethyl sulfoxide reductase subunit H [Salmonella sp. NCTC 11881]
MGSGWHEWPLMIFTVFGQCVVGALIVSGLGWLTAKDDTIARQRIVRSMFFSVAGDGTGIPRVDYASRLADARV